jgi:hypothetical protein
MLDDEFDKRYPDFAVWATQGGGLVKCFGTTYVFVEAPDSIFGLKAGDAMPTEWDVAPVNRLAREEERR